MSDGPTYCEKCANLHAPNKNDHPRYWMCVKHRRLEGFSYVMKGVWSKFPPYLYCNDVNGGACPLYEPAEPRQIKLLTEDER